MSSDNLREIIEIAAAVEQAHGETAHAYALAQAVAAAARGDVSATEKWNAAATMLQDLHTINCPLKLSSKKTR